MKKILLIAVILMALITSCVKKEVPQYETLLGLDYYPLTPGKYVIYNVDSVIYHQLPRDTVTYQYQVKEKLADAFSDNEGRTAYRLERYIKRSDPVKPYDSIPWTIKEVWMLTADEKKVQVVESNIRFTKLIFPVQEKASWNGNAQNTLGEQIYSYDYIEKEETIGDVKLDKVLKVKQLEYITLISAQSYSEKYAKGVGLVSREIKDVLSNNIIPGKNIYDRIESGIIYKQTLVSYGTE